MPIFVTCKRVFANRRGRGKLVHHTHPYGVSRDDPEVQVMSEEPV